MPPAVALRLQGVQAGALGTGALSTFRRNLKEPGTLSVISESRHEYAPLQHVSQMLASRRLTPIKAINEAENLMSAHCKDGCSPLFTPLLEVYLSFMAGSLLTILPGKAYET